MYTFNANARENLVHINQVQRNYLELGKIFTRVMGFLFLAGLLAGAPAEAETCSPLLDFSFRMLDDSRVVRLCEEYQGEVLLIVNTASKCAYTPQYEGLEALHEEYAGRGFKVLGFPSNDFGAQEPGTEGQVKRFCRLTYQVSFPMFAKTTVARGMATPFYRQLAKAGKDYPAWNFHKYLIDRNGNLAGSYPSHVKPGDKQLRSTIESLL